MSYLRTIAISTIALLSAASANATNLDRDFQRCASAALKDSDRTVSVINVANKDLTPAELDHSFSAHTAEYRMRVTNPASGEDLGNVTCTISRSGDLLSAFFDS